MAFDLTQYKTESRRATESLLVIFASASVFAVCEFSLFNAAFASYRRHFISGGCRSLADLPVPILRPQLLPFNENMSKGIPRCLPIESECLKSLPNGKIRPKVGDIQG